jgi:hypothetical protein
MSVDQVLKASIAASSVVEVRESAQYEPFGLLGRKLTAKDKVKKGIFLFSAAAAVGYYLFLFVLFLLH